MTGQPESKVEVAKRRGATCAAPSPRRWRPSATHFGARRRPAAQVPRHLPAGRPRRPARRSRPPGWRRRTASWSASPSPPAPSPPRSTSRSSGSPTGTATAPSASPPGRDSSSMACSRATSRPPSPASTRTLLTTISACGDVQRNVMGCSAPLGDADHAAVRRVAEALARRAPPASRAYHEIWLDGERQISTEEEEPFYGTATCRGSSRPPSASRPTTAWTSAPRTSDSSRSCGTAGIQGFNLLVGGGLGMTHNKGDTTARLAQPLGFVPAEHGVEAVRLVAAHLPRPRQPERPPPRPAQVPPRRVGHRPASARSSSAGRRSRWAPRSSCRRCRSTTTSAATARATAAGSTACSSRAAGSWTPGGHRAQDRAARDRDPAPARHPAHRPAEPAADRSRPRRPRAGRADPRGARRRSPGRALRRAPVLDGLPRPAHLRAGGGRVGAGDPGDPRPVRGRAREPRPARRAPHHPDDRLPQRLRAPVHRRHRVRGPVPRPLQRVRRRRARGGPAGGPLPRRRPGGRPARYPAPAAAALGHGASGRGRAGRLLPAAHGPARPRGRPSPAASCRPSTSCRWRWAGERPRAGPRGARLPARSGRQRAGPPAGGVAARAPAVRRGRRRVSPGRARLRRRARRAGSRRGDGRAVPHQRRPLQRGGPARGARAGTGGSARCGSGRRHRWAPTPAWRPWWRGGSPSCCASSTPSATRWRCGRGTRDPTPPGQPRRHRAAGRNPQAPAGRRRGAGRLHRRRPAAGPGRRADQDGQGARGAVPDRRRAARAAGHSADGRPAGGRRRPERPGRRPPVPRGWRGRRLSRARGHRGGPRPPAHAATRAALPGADRPACAEAAGTRAPGRRRPWRPRAHHLARAGAAALRRRRGPRPPDRPGAAARGPGRRRADRRRQGTGPRPVRPGRDQCAAGRAGAARPHRRPAQGRRSVRVRAGQRGGGGVPGRRRAGLRRAGREQRHRGAGGRGDSRDGARAGPLVCGGHRAPVRHRRRGGGRERARGGGHAGDPDGPLGPGRARGATGGGRPSGRHPGRVHPERHDVPAAGHPRHARHHRRGRGPGRIRKIRWSP